MERSPEVIITYCEFTNSFRICRLEIVVNGTSIYKPVPGLAYEHSTDAAQGADVYKAKENVR